MIFEGLLPEDFEEFRSVKFWDGFFQKRNQKAFEWYGDWRQLQPIVWEACAQPDKQILMLGCGNSDLSAEMYDSGCRNITNIDFSQICIKEMLRKNLRQRPFMKWKVMDMTQLTVAFDKGALDALMGEDTDAAAEAGSKLLSEVRRILTAQGQYICVTLAQPHVLKMLLSSFGLGWCVTIDRVPPSPDMARSPLQPFVIRVTRQPSPTDSAQQSDKQGQMKPGQEEVDGHVEDLDAIDVDDDNDNDKQPVGQLQNGADSGAEAAAVQLTFKPDAGAVNAEQLADVVQIVQQENKHRAAGGRRTEAQPSTSPQPSTQTPSQIPRPNPDSPSSPSVAKFDKLQPGRRCIVPLPMSAAKESKSENEGKARFTAAVLDVSAAAARQAVRDCAVFIVPQGREHEWLFASPEGQVQVAQGCSARRVIIVSFSRGHDYGSLKAVQTELSPLVSQLAPLAARSMEGAIPFMTTQEGIGSRVVLEEAESVLTGGISIEDVTLQEPGEADTVVRRMVFTSNRNLVQSEAILVPASFLTSVTASESGSAPNRPVSSAGKKAKGKSGKASKQNKSNATDRPQDLVIDHSVLACDYHKGIVAGLSLIQPHLSAVSKPTDPRLGNTQQQSQKVQQPQQAQQVEQPQQAQQAEQPQQAQQPERPQQPQQAQQHLQQEDQGTPALATAKQKGRPRAMVVGLGGGGLPVYLNQLCGMDVSVVELDPVVVQLATRHFGFTDSSTLQVSLQATVGDGLEAVAQLASHLASDAPAAPQHQSLHQSDSAAPPAPDSQHSQQLSGNANKVDAQETAQDGNGGTADSSAVPSSDSTALQQQQQLDVLVIDAGSGDASQPMSCPPPAFLETAFLQRARQVLKSEGMLVVNCVSRAIEPYHAAVKSLQAVFAEVYELDVDEDVNRVLFALPSPVHLSQPQQHQTKGKKHTKQSAKDGKQIQIDGSAAAVKLLKPRLACISPNAAQQTLASIESMLQNLSLVK